MSDKDRLAGMSWCEGMVIADERDSHSRDLFDSYRRLARTDGSSSCTRAELGGGAGRIENKDRRDKKETGGDSTFVTTGLKAATVFSSGPLETGGDWSFATKGLKAATAFSSGTTGGGLITSDGCVVVLFPDTFVSFFTTANGVHVHVNFAISSPVQEHDTFPEAPPDSPTFEWPFNNCATAK
jgi:hypothetical protein